MRYKLLGRSGLRVSEVALGTMTFGTEWGWGASKEESRRMFDAFVEAGGNFIDTANRYTDGTSERFVGEFVRTDRHRFVVATKYTLFTRRETATLFILFIGIAVGLNISELPSVLVTTYEASVYPWWAPVLGTLLFGIGTFVRFSGSNRDLFWMLLVLYIAMLGQFFGEYIGSSYLGAFQGATFMALRSELIARSPRRTPALVSQMLAFWFLVPGARGLLSVTSILSEDYQNALIGLGEMTVLITAIALGVFLGTLIISHG